MTTYAALEPGAYYLLRETIEDPIEYMTVILHTENTVLLRSLLPEQRDFFKLKMEEVEVIEELDDEHLAELQNLYEGGSEELFEFEEEDDED